MREEGEKTKAMACRKEVDTSIVCIRLRATIPWASPHRMVKRKIRNLGLVSKALFFFFFFFLNSSKKVIKNDF